MIPIKTSDNLIIIGKGESSYMANAFMHEFGRADIWTINEGSGWDLESDLPVWHFEVHFPRHHTDDEILAGYEKNKVSKARFRIVTRDDLDIQAMIRSINCKIFGNVLGYQFALALNLGYTKIGLPGIDTFKHGYDIDIETATFAFWVAYLKGKGIEIKTTSKCKIFQHDSTYARTFWAIGSKLSNGIPLTPEEQATMEAANHVYIGNEPRRS